jgi:hypothetical protein
MSEPNPQLTKEQGVEEGQSPSSLPPYPQGLFPLDDDEKKFFEEFGETDDETQIKLNCANKLWGLWLVYSSIVNNQQVVDLLKKPAKDGTPKHILQATIAIMIDKLGKCLAGNSNLTKELIYLKEARVLILEGGSAPLQPPISDESKE